MHKTGSRTAQVQPHALPEGFQEDAVDALPVRVEDSTDQAAMAAFEDVIDECDGRQTAKMISRFDLWSL